MMLYWYVIHGCLTYSPPSISTGKGAKTGFWAKNIVGRTTRLIKEEPLPFYVVCKTTKNQQGVMNT